MSFLLDTNVVSEWVKPAPNSGVIAWLAQTDEDTVFLSVVTLAELRFGIERTPFGARRTRFERWLRHDLIVRFEGRTLSIDPEIAYMWAHVAARSRAKGRPMSVMDAFLAATAAIHQLTIVTRNVSEFSALDIPVLNPWAG